MDLQVVYDGEGNIKSASQLNTKSSADPILALRLVLPDPSDLYVAELSVPAVYADMDLVRICQELRVDAVRSTTTLKPRS